MFTRSTFLRHKTTVVELSTAASRGDPALDCFGQLHQQLCGLLTDKSQALVVDIVLTWCLRSASAQPRRLGELSALSVHAKE